MSTYVLLTRPQAESERTARRLESLGHATVIEPMLEIVPLSFALPREEPLALAFTSRAAIAPFTATAGEKYLGLPVFCVGDATCKAAREAGFSQAVSASGDAADLEALIARAGYRRLWHPCGMDLSRDLAPGLAAQGIALIKIPVYAARPADYLSENFIALWRAEKITQALFFSARSAANFARLVRREKIEECARATAALCISGRVAKAAAPLPWKEVVVAERPDATAMTELLEGKA